VKKGPTLAVRPTRRAFLRALGSGAAVSWGGLKVFAGPSVSEPALLANQQGASPALFVYGTAFYRPPNPPIGERRAMLKSIAQRYQFNTVRIYSAWVYHHLAPDRFDFTELTEVMGYCDEFGLRVLFGVILEEAPYWLEAAHPQSRYVNANDHAQRLGVTGNNVSGGWPGLCLDSPPVRRAAAVFIRKVVGVVSQHPSLYAYDCWNEAHIEPAVMDRRFPGATTSVEDSVYCYCPATLAAFRRWLEQRYGTLENLNAAWVRRYSRWALVDPPRAQGTYLDWLDWRRFMIERTTVELRFRVEHIRAVDKRGLLECHALAPSSVAPAPLGPLALLGVNAWRLAELVQTWGISNFPRWEPTPVYLGAAGLELTRCQANSQPFWMTELQAGRSGLLEGRNMRPQDIRLWNWLAVATGAKGILYWTYHTEATGTESGGFGLVARDGSPTERMTEAMNDHEVIRAYGQLIRQHLPKPEVAILFDQDNALLAFAMYGSEQASFKSYRGYYKAFWRCDLWVDFVEPEQLPGSAYKVIAVPWHLMAKEKTSKALRAFVESGGTLILESGFGIYDERTNYNSVIPPHGLAELFGYREGESYTITGPPDACAKTAADTDRVYSEGHLTFFEPFGGTVKAHSFLTPVIVSGATVIAHYESMPVAVTAKVGQGRVYYIGTNLGASIEAGDRAGCEFIRAVLRDVIQPSVTAKAVRPRLIEGGGRQSLLVVFNEDSDDHLADITVPERFSHALDLYSQEKFEIHNHRFPVNVTRQSVAVLLLE
jgi:beta-galactosidase